jgi:hypothetical protein
MIGGPRRRMKGISVAKVQTKIRGMNVDGIAALK